MKSPVEEREHTRHLASVLQKESQKKRNWLFMVAYDCNFRCPYCFENAISANGKGWSKKVFTKTAVDRAYAAMLELEPDRNRHKNQITLYGGEPLLARNREIVKYIVNEGLERGYRFAAITNGYELEHFKELLNPRAINNLQISIDGLPEIHNARRTHFEDGATFDKIIKNIKLCLSQEVFVTIRVNTDANNLDDINTLKEIFKKHGLFGDKNFKIYTAVVHGDTEINCNSIMSNTNQEIDQSELEKEERAYSSNLNNQYLDFEKEEIRYLKSGINEIVFHDDSYESQEVIRTLNRTKYLDRYHDLVEKDPEVGQITCQDFGLQGRVLDILKSRGMPVFRSVFCTAQTGMMIFDPYGDLYSCWETVGMEKHIVGRYRDGVELEEEELNNWYGRNIGTTVACSKCKYAFFCGGGCQAHALAEGRGYGSPHCDGFPGMFQRVVPKTYETYKESLKKTVL